MAHPQVPGKGDGSLQAPLTITVGRPGPITVNSGDFNGDGKFDLVVANGSASNQPTGSPSILILLQNPLHRQEWSQSSMRVGASAVFVRAVDMNKDGFDDILVGDLVRSAFFVRSRGDGTFDAPAAIVDAAGSRWICPGDWDNNGTIDFASANFGASNLTIFLNDGTPKFTLNQSIPGNREHVVEAMDYDGDGLLDLILAIGPPGMIPHCGQGNGTFVAGPLIENFACVEYISEAGYYRNGKYIVTGDFNKDGKGDLAATCVNDGTAYAGTSRGDGAFQSILQERAGGGTDATAIGDLNGDGNADLAIASRGSTNLWVHPGKGDGTFMPPVVFGPTGSEPAFLIAQDLDADGHVDVISGEQASFSVTVFWGREGERFLASGLSVSGFTGAKAAAAADFDGDGAPDLFFPRSDAATVNVFLQPGQAASDKPSLAIATAKKYSLLELADLNGDRVPDLLGADPVAGNALVALLDAGGQPIPDKQLALPAGLVPASIEVGLIDDGPVLDMAIPCKGSNHVAVFLGKGGGAFAEARIVPTVDRPKDAALGRWDSDAHLDMALIADTKVAVQFGKGGGDFDAPVPIVEDASRLFTGVAAGDVNGDSFLDVVASDSKGVGVLIYPGTGGRGFGAPVVLKPTGVPSGLVLADMDGNGALDIIAASATGLSISMHLNRGAAGFASAVGYGMGLSPAGLLVEDLNLDGALDVIGFAPSAAMILLGRPAASVDQVFLRGDASGDGHVEINDPILVIQRLFLAGEPLACEDAADANDDGAIDVTDPIAAIGLLFLGGAPLPPPGPDACGPDPTDDGLGACNTQCR